MSSQQSGNTVARAVQARVQDQGARIAAIEARLAGQDSTMANLTSQLQSLEVDRDTSHQFARMAAAELSAHAKRMDYFESLIRAAHEDGNLALPAGVLENEANPTLGNEAQDAGGGESTGGVPVSVDDSEIQKDSSLKEAVIECLISLTGLPHLHDYSSMVYPTVPESDPQWPSTTKDGQRSPYMRLNLDQPFDDPQNWQKIQTWAHYVVNHGAEVTPAVRVLLPRLSFEQVLTACKNRFTYLRKEFRRKSLAQGSKAPQDPPLAEGQLGSDPSNPTGTNECIDPALLDPQGTTAGPGAPPATSPIDIRSRATGKSQKRQRQREHLMGENEKYKDPKYNQAFEPGAMSDDEDEYTLADGVWVKTTGIFVSREWAFISQELRDCRNAVDAIPDPNERARTVRRKRGEPKAGSPKKWEKEKWAMEAWMIDSAVLAANPEWLAKGRILANGPAWQVDGQGEGQDQVTHRPAKRGRTGRGSSRAGVASAGPGPSTAKAREARKALQEAEERAREVRGDDDLEAFMMNLG